MYTGAELKVLIEAYREATGISVTALAQQIIPAPAGDRPGHHPRQIRRIIDGQEVFLSAAERISHWLNENWPAGVPWPLDEQQAAAQ